MRTELYTAESICKCMGLPGFEQDPACTSAVDAVRILLKPSFHPELCVTFADGRASVVCARSMIWHQFEPSPMLTYRAEGILPSELFARLLASLAPVARPGAVPGLVIDGMPSELLSFRRGEIALRAGGNAGTKGDFSSFLAFAINTTWHCISDPHCRNSLADAAEYVGMKLPREQKPARKPTVETLVLGPEEDRRQLLEALRRRGDA